MNMIVNGVTWGWPTGSPSRHLPRKSDAFPHPQPDQTPYKAIIESLIDRNVRTVSHFCDVFVLPFLSRPLSIGWHILNLLVILQMQIQENIRNVTSEISKCKYLLSRLRSTCCCCWLDVNVLDSSPPNLPIWKKENNQQNPSLLKIFRPAQPAQLKE